MAKNRLINTIDLHGIRHEEVQYVLANELFWKKKRNCHIITGNSDLMRSAVLTFLEKNDYHYFVEHTNRGQVIIIE